MYCHRSASRRSGHPGSDARWRSRSHEAVRSGLLKRPGDCCRLATRRRALVDSTVPRVVSAATRKYETVVRWGLLTGTWVANARRPLRETDVTQREQPSRDEGGGSRLGQEPRGER
jgi:hypothetical protein